MNVEPLRVRRAREEAGLTMAQLADGRLSRTAIHLIEAGRARPSEETLAHISSRTGKPLSYFTGGSDTDLPGSTADAARRSIDLLRQASWSLGQLLQRSDLSGSERVALKGLMFDVRHGMRLVAAIDGTNDAEPD